jgi:hypothetical protein
LTEEGESRDANLGIRSFTRIKACLIGSVVNKVIVAGRQTSTNWLYSTAAAAIVHSVDKIGLRDPAVNGKV